MIKEFLLILRRKTDFSGVVVFVLFCGFYGTRGMVGCLMGLRRWMEAYSLLFVFMLLIELGFHRFFVIILWTWFCIVGVTSCRGIPLVRGLGSICAFCLNESCGFYKLKGLIFETKNRKAQWLSIGAWTFQLDICSIPFLSVNVANLLLLLESRNLMIVLKLDYQWGLMDL